MDQLIGGLVLVSSFEETTGPVLNETRTHSDWCEAMTSGQVTGRGLVQSFCEGETSDGFEEGGVCFFSLSLCLVLSQARDEGARVIFTVCSASLPWLVNVCRCMKGTEGGERSASLQEETRPSCWAAPGQRQDGAGAHRVRWLRQAGFGGRVCPTPKQGVGDCFSH